MIQVEFLGPIGNETISLNIKNLTELKDILNNDSRFENIKQWLDDCAVAVNNKMVDSLDIPLSSGDKVTLLPPVCGG